MTNNRAATIRQWISWTERQISIIVVNEGLHVALVGVTQGPHTITFRLRLIRPDRTGLKRLLSLGPVFAQALHVDQIRVVDSGKGVLVEVPSPQPRSPSATILARLTRGLRVAVGIDQWRQPAVIDLVDHPVVLWVGPSGKGKTSAMRSTIFALASCNSPKQFRFVVVAQKGADWQNFASLAQCLAVVTDPREAEDALLWASSTLLPRRTREGASTPAVVFVVDDLVSLLIKSPGIVVPLVDMASQGRAAGIFTFIGTQQAGSKTGTGSTVIENNITARIVFRSSSATSGARDAGAGNLNIAQLSGEKGDALLIVDDLVSRVATGFTDDRDVALLPTRKGPLRPWLKRSDAGVEQPRTAQNSQNSQNSPVLAPFIQDNNDAETGPSQNSSAEQGPKRLPGNRPPTRNERYWLRDLYNELGSKHKVCFAAWGFKNGIVYSWLEQALKEED